MKRKCPTSPMDQVMQCLEIHIRLIDLFLLLEDVVSLNKAFPVLQLHKRKALSWDKICQEICSNVRDSNSFTWGTFKWGIWKYFAYGRFRSELQFTAEYGETEILVLLNPQTYKCYFTYQGDSEASDEEDEENLRVTEITETFGCSIKHDLMKRLRYNSNVLAVFHSFLSNLTRDVLVQCKQNGSKMNTAAQADLTWLRYCHRRDAWSPYE